MQARHGELNGPMSESEDTLHQFLTIGIYMCIYRERERERQRRRQRQREREREAERYREREGERER